MRYMIFVDFCGGFLSTALSFLHCFAAYSYIIMDKESIKHWHLLTSINDVFTITNGFVQTYLFHKNTHSAPYILLYHFTGSNSSLVCNENTIYMYL